MVLILILTTAFYLPALPMILLPWEVEAAAICLEAPMDGQFDRAGESTDRHSSLKPGT